MIIQNTSGDDIFLGWIGKNGRWVSNGGTTEIADTYSLTKEFRSAKNTGAIIVISYDDGDDTLVTQRELKDAAIGGGGGRVISEPITVSAPGDYQFTLSNTPLFGSSSVALIVDGVHQEYGTTKDFYVTGTTLDWTNRHFQLDPSMWVLARYEISA